MNHSTSSGFDQFQPPQYPVIHQPRQEMSTEMLLVKEKLIKAIQTCLKNNNQLPEGKSIAVLLAENSLEEKQIDTEVMQELLLNYIEFTTLNYTLDFNTQEEEQAAKIYEEIESSVKNLNLTPSESEDLSDIKILPLVMTSHFFLMRTFTKENFKIYLNPLFDEEIISTKINPHHFNAESDLIESLLNKDTVITSPKIDFLLEEFAGELALINPIPPGIAETNFDPKKDIRLIKKLVYDNSSPRPPEELNTEISDAIIESFSSSPSPLRM
ncbi:hypothetical protein Tco_0782202 [Tanacetum coccineum]